MRDYAQVKGDGRITPEIARDDLEVIGVDEMGLDDLDRKYLRALIEYYNGGPAGLNAMAATLGQDEGTLQDFVERYSLKIGFVIRTPLTARSPPAPANTWAYRSTTIRTSATRTWRWTFE